MASQDTKPESKVHTSERPQDNLITSPTNPKISKSRARSYKHQSEGQPTRSLEPILFPKLRIKFADFPYLHYSID